MNIDKNIERLIFTISKQNKPNETDLKALNFIIEWVNSQRVETLNNYHLFAKLYIYYLDQFVNKYDADIFDPIPQKELSRLLSFPLSTFYVSFTDSLNDANRNRLLKEKGVKVGVFPSEKTEEEHKKETESITLEDFKDAWDLETVTDNLNAMMVEVVNRFK